MENLTDQNNSGFTQAPETCLLCHSIRIQSLQGYESNFLFKCEVCGFVFCGKRPSADELKQHYGGYPRGTAISPITLTRYERLLDEFEKHRKTNNLMDVGCGDGHFLETAKKRGWSVQGTEFSKEAIDICRGKGISMVQGPLKPGQFPEGYFDIVTSFEVLEHLNTPHEELRAIHSVLRIRGLVYVTTPNFNSISRTLMGYRWNVIEYPEHLTYYTRATLKKLFAGNGFELIHMSTSGVSPGRILKSRARGIKPSPGLDEAIRTRTEKNILFGTMKRSINLVLNLTGKGDGIKALFQKVDD